MREQTLLLTESATGAHFCWDSHTLTHAGWGDFLVEKLARYSTIAAAATTDSSVLPMRASDIDLRALLRFGPESGQLPLGEERFLLFRQEAFGTLRRLLFEQLGPVLTPSLLAHFGYR